MKGLTSHDGKLAGNRQQVESYDKAHGKGPKPESKAGGGGGDANDRHQEGGDGRDVKQVVSEHGPAHTHIITKGAGSGHHSETHHESGHVHHADHETLDEAHDHGKDAMGEGDAETIEQEPDGDEPDGDEMAGGAGSGRGTNVKSTNTAHGFMA